MPKENSSWQKGSQMKAHTPREGGLETAELSQHSHNDQCVKETKAGLAPVLFRNIYATWNYIYYVTLILKLFFY